MLFAGPHSISMATMAVCSFDLDVVYMEG